jgi:hypothetical protein
MTTSSRFLTVDQAGSVLGLSRHHVIELIGTGTLTWTMAADKRTVLVEIPSDRDVVMQKIRAFVLECEAARRTSSSGLAAATRETKQRRDVRHGLSDDDAWSQPK